jgi:hypothetical protein
MTCPQIRMGWFLKSRNVNVVCKQMGEESSQSQLNFLFDILNNMCNEVVKVIQRSFT